LSDGELVFLVNTSTAAPTAVKLTSRMNGVEQWRLDAGDTAPFPFRATATGVEADFHLPPVGSILLFLPRAPRPPAAAPPPSRLESVAPSGPLEVKRSQPNVLVLDYLDVKCQGQELKNAYFHAASQFVFRQHGF
jgi:hypothetical protein